MVLPPWLYLGFFVTEPDGHNWPDRSVVVGPHTDTFEHWVAHLFGELPSCPGEAHPVYRDAGGGVAIFLADLVGQQKVADSIIELQQRTGCQCIMCSKFDARLIGPAVMTWELQYYTQEFGKVLAWWREQTARREAGE